MRLSILFMLTFFLLPSGAFALADKGNDSLNHRGGQVVKQQLQTTEEKVKLMIEDRDSNLANKNDHEKQLPTQAINQGGKAQTQISAQAQTQTTGEKTKRSKQVRKQTFKEEKSVSVKVKSARKQQLKKGQVTPSVKFEHGNDKKNSKNLDVSIPKISKKAVHRTKNTIEKRKKESINKIEKVIKSHQVTEQNWTTDIADSPNQLDAFQTEVAQQKTSKSVEDIQLNNSSGHNQLPHKEQQQPILVILTMSSQTALPSKSPSGGMHVSIPLQVYATVNEDEMISEQTQRYGTRVEIFRNQWVNAPPFQPPKVAA